MSHKEMYCLRSYFVCTFPDNGCVCRMTSKPNCRTNFSEQKNVLLAELGRDFPEVESKGYDSKTWAKKKF